MGNRFYYGMPATDAFKAMNALEDDVKVLATAAAGDAHAAASSAGAAASRVTEAAAARDAALAAWRASTAPAEQLAPLAQNFHGGTVVDCFLYDTSKDSDGGAWRKRCKGTSWENEALVPGKWLGQIDNTVTAVAAGGQVGDYFQAGPSYSGGAFFQITNTGSASATQIYRGNGREFPAVALIVAEANRIVIYDATQSSLPMWMVFTSGHYSATVNGASHTSVAAINGDILFGMNAGTNFVGLQRFSFPADAAYGYRIAPTYNTDQRIARKAHPLTADWVGGASFQGIVNAAVNDVTATVLPDAPVDPATGLPVPTIAVATEGGISEIQNTGVVNNYATGFRWHQIAYADQNFMFGRKGTTGSGVVYSTFTRVQRITGTEQTYAAPLANPLVNAVARNSVSTVGKGLVFNAADTGLSILKDIQNAPNKSMVAHITNAYNSGWQVGDSRGAWLADTVAETITGSGELITNGTFSTDLTGWTVQVGGSSTVTWVGGAAQIAPDGVNGVYLAQQLTLIPGRSYTMTFTIGGNAIAPLVGTTVTSGNVLAGSSANYPPGTYSVTFTATQANLWIAFSRTAAIVGMVDNVSVKLASSDRSVKGKGLIVNGSITKAAVAAGAQLVGYSGFTATSYLEQPYNSDLEFADDFSMALWVYVPAAITGRDFVKRTTKTGAGNSDGAFYMMYTDNTGNPRFQVGNGTTAAGVSALSAISTGRWIMLVGVRRNTAVELWVDGVLQGSVAGPAGSLANSAAVLMAGSCYWNGVITPCNSTLALLRLMASALSADQIAQMYRDELAMFQPGAQCTINGTQPGVNALAYDDSADVLHVGTSWGRSVFKGLVRLTSEAGSVSSLAAAQGAVLVGSGVRNLAYYYQPAQLLRDELKRKDENRRALASLPVPHWFTGTGAIVSFTLPAGFDILAVYRQGLLMREGSTNDYTTSFDGYRWKVTFPANVPNNYNICIMGVRNGAN